MSCTCCKKESITREMVKEMLENKRPLRVEFL